MAVSTPKRKVDGGVPSPARPRKKANSASSPVAAQRVRKRAARGDDNDDDDEYEADAGRAESSGFLALVRFETTKRRRAHRENRGFMERFEKGLAEGEEGLRRALTEGEGAATERDARFLQAFQTALAASRGGDAGSDVDFEAIRQKSRDVVSAAHALVAKFEGAVKRVDDIDTTALLENDWGADNENLKALFKQGMDIGVERYRRILNASKEESLLEGAKKQVSNELFGVGSDEAAEGGWGKVAKKQERALRKLVKAVEC